MPIGMFAGSIGRDGEGFGIFHHIVEGIVCIDADDAVQMGGNTQQLECMGGGQLP